MLVVSDSFDGWCLYVGGCSFLTARKCKNVRAGSPNVGLTADDRDPATGGPRGIKVQRRAEIVERDGPKCSSRYFRIMPKVARSWGIEQPAFVDGRTVFHRSINAERDEGVRRTRDE